MRLNKHMKLHVCAEIQLKMTYVLKTRYIYHNNNNSAIWEL